MSHGLVLPPEVWSHVLKQIPKPNMPQLLHVCSLFHDILIRSVFSSIKIYFIGTKRGAEMLNTTNVEWIDETARKLMCKSWEILNHICQTPGFGRIVKSISVIAFGDGMSFFERLTLANTLLFIPNLHTFRWIGVGPDFDGTVAECLPSNLQKLVIQSSLPLESLQHLKNITNLHLSTPLFFPDDEESHDDWTIDPELMDLREDPLEPLFNTFSSLRSLRITGSQVRGVPVRIYNNLTELEIIMTVGDEDDVVGLDLVFHHATMLESLTLVGFIIPELFSFLPPFSSGALPRLTSFRMSSEFIAYRDPQDGENRALCEFLHGRTRMRRLYIRIPSLRWPQAESLFPTITSLPNLEVLGFHAGYEYMDERGIEPLLQILSPKLCALHLAFTWDNTSLLTLVEAIGRLPCLSFLHIYGSDNRLPLLLEDLATVGERLQTIGLNRALWDIERVGSNIITDKWPRWKIKYSVEDDFLCEDDAWLFMYN